MMKAFRKPTAAELRILTVLWRIGPATVRQVHADLEAGATGYTTVLKLMQIMADKGLLRRDEKDRAHVYHPAVERSAAQRQLARDLVDRLFGGSTAQLVLHALPDRPASKKEIAEIRAMLDEWEKGKKK